MAALLLLVGSAGVVPAQTVESDMAAGDAPTRVRLALQWQPQSQFAGYYMARERGIYRAHGLDVQLLHAGTERSSLDLLRAGQVDLATAFLSDALVAAMDRSDPSRLALNQVAQLVQRSNLLLVAWKDMGITRPTDLAGRRVSHWQGSFATAFDAFFSTNGISVIRVPQYASVSLFLKRGVAACAAMRYNEYHRLWQAGIDADQLTIFDMGELDFGFAEDGLYGTAGWVAQHPEIIRALREATLAGWSYARDHPEETIEVVLDEAGRAGVPANRPHERWMLDHLLGAIFLSGAPPERAGRLDPDAFDHTARALQSAGLLTRVPRFAEFAPLEGQAP